MPAFQTSRYCCYYCTTSLSSCESHFEMLDPPTTVDDLKRFHFASRGEAYECIQLYHARLRPPKKLKMIRENMGSRVTYRCVDVDCPVLVSLKKVTKNKNETWVVFDREGYPEQWNHGSLCECVISLSTRTSARILQDVDLKGRDLVIKARDHGINLGGCQTQTSDIGRNQLQAARRVNEQIAKLYKNVSLDLISKLPLLLEEYKITNHGAYASFKLNGNILKSCLIVSQLSICMSLADRVLHWE